MLKPGGTFGLVWNIRDETEPWVQRLTRVMHGSRAEEWVADPDVPASFGAVERFESRWSRPFDEESLLALVASRSYFITASDEEKARIDAGVRAFLRADPDLRVTTEWRMPYRTVAFRMRRPG